MNITFQTIDDILMADLDGEIDAKTAPTVTEQFLPLIKPGSKILMNLTEVAYMSSAGLRLLLSLYRQSTAQDSKLVLVGLSEDIKDTMSNTGFLDFFVTADTIDQGIHTLK